MKKIIILLMVFLLFPSINSFALNILSGEFGLEIGWLPQGTLNMYEEIGGSEVWSEDGGYWTTEVEKYDLSNTFYILLSTRIYCFEYLFLGGSVDMSFHKQMTDYTFSTEGTDYMFEFGIQVGILEIFYKHNCIHPTPTYLYKYLFNGKWETSHDRVGIKIFGKIGD